MKHNLIKDTPMTEGYNLQKSRHHSYVDLGKIVMGKRVKRQRSTPENYSQNNASMSDYDFQEVATFSFKYPISIEETKKPERSLILKLKDLFNAVKRRIQRG